MIKEEKHNTRLERGREMVEDFILRSGDGNDKKHYRSLARYAALPLVLTVDLLNFLRQEFLRDIPWIVEVDLLLSDLCLEAGEDIYIMNQDARTYLISELRSEDDGLKNIERVNLSLLDHLDFLSKNHRSLKSREWETQKLSAMLCIFEKREEAVRTISRHLETLLNRPNQGSSDQSDENKKVKSELRWLSSFVSEMAENLEQYPGLVEAAVLIGQIMSARTPEEVDSIRNEVDSDRELADLPGISKPIRIDAIFRQILPQELSLLPNRPVTKIGPPDIFDDPQLRELIERTIISGNGNLDREEKMRAESMVRDLKSTRDSYKSAETLIQLGELFQKVENYADALHFYEYAQHTAAEPLQRAHIFRHIGDAKRQLQDSEGARRSYQSAVKLANEAEDPLLEAEVLRTLVELEIEAGNHDWVIEHARRAIEILRKHRSPDLAFFQSLLFQSQNRDQFPDVFIIEAHQDSRFVETAVAQMMESGLNVWRNQKIAPGSDLEFERKRKLYRSSHVLFFCSEDSISLKYCRKEFDLAKRLQKPIIPVMIRHCLIPEWLAEYQSIDLTESGKNRDDHQISKLCKSILSQRSTRRGFTELLPGDVELELVFIPGGEFLMGGRYPDEKPRHHVSVNSFYFGRTPVTQDQWRGVMGSLPKVGFKGNDRPVETVNWNESVEFCRRLSEQTGLEFRLPTEAEWEYAARAGTTTEYSFGDDEKMLGEYAWFNKNSGSSTHAVAQKLPNQFGLYDMHGNVWEWCEDKWHENYEGAPGDGSAWLSGGDSTRRVVRGGSWYDVRHDCRSALRFRNHPVSRDDHFGLRLVVGARTSGP